MKIALYSEYGEGAYFAWLFKNNGHAVDIFINTPECREALGGMVNRVEGLSEISSYDLVIFDVTGNGKTADEARLLTPTIGDSVLADKLEEDRVYSLELMQQCGIQVPPWERFTEPSTALRYIRKKNCAMVFKPVGDETDKSTTYVAKSAEDMIRYFDVLSRSTHVKEFVLQDVVKGTEVSTEVYINETGYYALNHTLELKKLMNGNHGPNTGCSGALVWMAHDNPIFEKGLKKAVEPLQKIGYVGPIDLNTIVNDAGVWGLEFCARFGYDATALLTRLLPVDFADLLYAIASNNRPPDLTPKHSFCATTRLSIPPYPCEGLPQKFYKIGVPIEGLSEKNLDRFYAFDVRKRSEEADDLESAGICGWLGGPLSIGETIGQAFDGADDVIKSLTIPNCQYRTDVRDNTARRYIELRNGGWLRPTHGDSQR